MKPVLVIWEDAYDESGDHWTTIASPVEGCYIQTMGFLVYQDPERIALCMNVAGDQCSRKMVIPAGMVRQIVEIDLSAVSATRKA